MEADRDPHFSRLSPKLGQLLVHESLLGREDNFLTTRAVGDTTRPVSHVRIDSPILRRNN